MFPRFTLKLKKKNHVHQHDDGFVWRKFQTWYTSALGQRLAQSEKNMLDKCLPDLFGYYLLQCGCPEIKVEKGVGQWLKKSRVASHIFLDFEINQGISCQSHLAHLPMKADSLDVVVLPHVLDFSSVPHQVLREVERVLIAEGHVVILGFNPWSLWNIFRLFLFWTKQPPWNAHFLAASRVMDWLALLGFDVVQHRRYFYQPPVQSEKIIKKMFFLENVGQRFWSMFGAGYILVARKRVQTLTPIRPRWRTGRQVIRHGLETVNRNKL